MAATKEPNIQSTERDLKQNVIAAHNEFALYFQLLLFNVPLSIPAEQKCLS